ncbi:hypothetical protein BVRB_5g115800 [Beta vulgaris subsp. vulgaris]|nr:hypothetical protein BVRB_5g115800 [Beta vulgaris subsp. vulgaris]
MKPFAAFMLVVLLALSIAMLPNVAEGRMCTNPSKTYKGPCVSDTNCESVCQSEGFPQGNCHGFRRRCICGKPCA